MRAHVRTYHQPSLSLSTNFRYRYISTSTKGNLAALHSTAPSIPLLFPRHSLGTSLDLRAKSTRLTDDLAGDEDTGKKTHHKPFK
jgi:hypothetical protein